MSVFKCKMCGGDLALIEGQSVAECEYCGTWQTVPSADNEKKLTLFARANRLRVACEFDKAAGIYEAIVADFQEEAEAYWGLVLCKYGIEYVDDPVTGKKVPTCHRSSFDSIMEDSDFEQALENADSAARRVYRAEAKQIEEVRKGIIAVSNNEVPYDIFICYKETDEKGNRTLDSVLGQDIYDALTAKGYRVFFSRITLEDKLGLEYEPYIFAALNSAKIMLAVGTDIEYYNAVWVKNEWSRFLKLMAKDKVKHLIPCYKGIDVYDMPQEFVRLQAQDLGKMGAIQDLLRGIEKLLPKKEDTISIAHGEVFNNKIDTLLKRAFMFLEDGDWKHADEYCEKVLDADPECAEAYLGKLLAELHVNKKEALKGCEQPFDRTSHYQKALRFAGDALRKELQTSLDYINERNKKRRAENAAKSRKRKKRVLCVAIIICALFVTTEGILLAKPLFQYLNAVSLMRKGEYVDAIVAFEMLDDFMDSDKKIVICETAILDSKYNEAIVLMEADKYEEAIAAFEALDGYKDSATKILDIKYNDAVALMDAGKYEEAITAFEALNGYKDSTNKISACNTAILDSKYNDAIALMDAGNIVGAYQALITLDGYKDSADQADSIYDKYKLEILKSAKVGDYVFFGAYEQDNNTSNGKENIEWLVLEVKNERALLISKYALDCKQYHTSSIDVTWEICSLRKWLNSDFLNSAFSTEEKAMIPMVTVSADKNPEYSTNPGKATQDKVFLLSITEANKYFKSDSVGRCRPTSYSFKRGINHDYQYWLRTSDRDGAAATILNTGGSYQIAYRNYTTNSQGVRPALWIDLNLLNRRN